MKVNVLKQLIKEAIADRIKMIDEAGDIAALEAKIKKVDEDIKDAMDVKSSLTSMAGLKYYVSPEIIGDMMDDMEASIKELQTKKKDLEDQKKAMDKNAKGPKKSEKKEDKKELKELSSQQAGVNPAAGVAELSKMVEKAAKVAKEKGSKYAEELSKIASALSAGMSKGVTEAELNETFQGLVKKLEKPYKSKKTGKVTKGKSPEAAAKIAGAVAAAKMKGAGSGPTKKQTTRLKEEDKVEEGLPKGYFKKEYGIGKKTKK